VNTEMTDKVARHPTAGWVCYDGECALCLRWVRRVERSLLRRGFSFVPLQTEWVKVRLNLTADDPLTEMRVLRPDQLVLGGADAAVTLMRHVWWLWPLWLFSRIPGAMLIFRAVYRHIAANRHCASGACAIPKQNRWHDWLPLLALLIATLPFRAHLANWIFMWLFVTAMFAGCKWLTWRRAHNPNPNTTRTLGYLFLWPGMDAKSFLTEKQTKVPRFSEWLPATSCFVAGIMLVWLAARQTLTAYDVANAWLGMFGLTLILHFGLFHLTALAWQHAGVPAKPLMQSPATATSLADFWGARWNTAFNKLVHDLAFRPLARRAGVAWATMGVFAISGIIHELAISFPARGGYGFPLGYFILQGIGVLIERSRAGRALGLGHGWRGWLFMFCFTAAPAYWLFHPTFVQNVILPMLQTIGAI
jgi:predicted DCC family thiol-disulfide oxidoreductase YuxK